ncbi:MAG TPA: fatty acid--CoA ligase family protein, partial [Candidatus Polarisedimenticolia bacterium]|nr:fatty acid--CoA ligase family protein [Candidatus Polarisedimenticolia bacterium]
MQSSGPDPIVAAFDRLARRHGDRPLVLSASTAVTVAEIDAMARALARRLQGARLPAEAPVGLRGSNGAGFLAGLLACRRAGHPVALFDAGVTARERRVTARHLALAAILHAPPGARAGNAFRLARLAARRGARVPAGTAVIKLTSGSSGRPRGVACTAEALLADDEAIRAGMGIGEGDRLVAAVPFAHSYGLSSLVVPALTRGLPLLVPDAGVPLAPWLLAQKLGGTVLPTVPAFAAGLVALEEGPAWPATLRLLVTAGAPLWPETAARLRRRYGRRAHVFYGASECGGIAYDPSGEAGERGTVGAPLPGVRLRLEPVAGAVRGTGRLVVRSASVALSYLPAPEEALRDGRFVTSDLVRRHGDAVELLGRLDALINVRGRKIDPREVERHIARLRPVRDVVVHAVTAPGGEPRVRAVVA